MIEKFSGERTPQIRGQQKSPSVRGGEEVRMSAPITVKRGIYIDMGCSYICQIDDGVFIPTGYGSAESNKKFQEDLKAFLDKWFTPCEGENCCGDIKS